MLIQQTKAFQTVVKMEGVINKNVLHFAKLDKVKGKTFHVPLPLEKTLRKICPDSDPINLSHKLYVLVCSNPIQEKIIWEEYIDIRKIWKALYWLMDNN